MKKLLFITLLGLILVSCKSVNYDDFYYNDINTVNDSKRKKASTENTNRTGVFFSEAIYFEFDSEKVENKYHQTILKVVDRLKNSKNYVLVIEGHADNSGSAGYNKILSEQRANAVMQEILRLDPSLKERISIIGKGIDNSSKSSDKKRRVDLKIYLSE